MILSMTGYGRTESQFRGRKLVCEIRSLNSKAMDLTVRLQDPVSADLCKCPQTGMSRLHDLPRNGIRIDDGDALLREKAADGRFACAGLSGQADEKAMCTEQAIPSCSASIISQIPQNSKRRAGPSEIGVLLTMRIFRSGRALRRKYCCDPAAPAY